MDSVGNVRGGKWKRGDYAAYLHAPETKLLIISDPYDYGGRQVVTARTCEKSKAKRQFGLYAVHSLTPWAGKE